MCGDRGLVRTACANLLDNAVKYNRPGGRVEISASADDDRVRIVVIDTGIGIPARDRQRIFERFYRVDQARSRETGGTGLGLSIVKHVAELHGGSVGLVSTEGAGSTFTITLPLRAES
jgi:signal transduction histidine kinase